MNFLINIGVPFISLFISALSAAIAGYYYRRELVTKRDLKSRLSDNRREPIIQITSNGRGFDDSPDNLKESE